MLLKIIKILIGAYLIVQAVFGAAAATGASANPKYMDLLLILSAASGYGGFKILRSADKPKQPANKEII